MLPLIIVCDVLFAFAIFYHFSDYPKNIFIFYLGQGFQFSNPTENFFICEGAALPHNPLAGGLRPQIVLYFKITLF
jgi:hypothetical protein